MDRLENKSRVLYSIWTPTIWTVSDEFVLINYPTNSRLSNGEMAYKLIPVKFKAISSFGYQFLQGIIMTNDQYQWVNKKIWEIDGVFETLQQRLNQTCSWIKHQIYHDNDGVNAWLQWIPDDIRPYMYDCNDYDDSHLQSLFWVMSNHSDLDLDFIENQYIDEATAYRIISNCLSEGDTMPLILIVMKGIAIGAGIVQLVYVAIVFANRHQVCG